MDIEKAMDYIEDLIVFREEPTEESIPALHLALAVMSNHIPMKPIDYGVFFGLCPICKTEFNSELRYEYEIKFCPYCGQALDWSDYDE